MAVTLEPRPNDRDDVDARVVAKREGEARSARRRRLGALFIIGVSLIGAPLIVSFYDEIWSGFFAVRARHGSWSAFDQLLSDGHIVQARDVIGVRVVGAAAIGGPPVVDTLELVVESPRGLAALDGAWTVLWITDPKDESTRVAISHEPLRSVNGRSRVPLDTFWVRDGGRSLWGRDGGVDRDLLPPGTYRVRVGLELDPRALFVDAPGRAGRIGSSRSDWFELEVVEGRSFVASVGLWIETGRDRARTLVGGVEVEIEVTSQSPFQAAWRVRNGTDAAVDVVVTPRPFFAGQVSVAPAPASVRDLAAGAEVRVPIPTPATVVYHGSLWVEADIDVAPTAAVGAAVAPEPR